jgi:hypothetical protein
VCSKGAFNRIKSIYHTCALCIFYARDDNTAAKIKRCVQVCQLCVWTRHDGELFRKLKDIARGLMDSLAHLCDERYQSLLVETGGPALLAFRTDPKNMDGLISIRRQDHPQVLRWPRCYS